MEDIRKDMTVIGDYLEILSDSRYDMENRYQKEKRSEGDWTYRFYK